MSQHSHTVVEPGFKPDFHPGLCLLQAASTYNTVRKSLNHYTDSPFIFSIIVVF